MERQMGMDLPMGADFKERDLEEGLVLADRVSSSISRT